MPVRSITQQQYFEELARTSEKYFLPYVETMCPLGKDICVLEIGCGVGGNLVPFARRGCRVVGVDLFKGNTDVAEACFEAGGLAGSFAALDFFEMEVPEELFDVVICHDVIEHIGDKTGFLLHMRRFAKPGGLFFISFPAWQMPFGGHHQNCRSRLVSHCPYLHLLPRGMYKWVLERFHESDGTIREMLEIKETRTPIEKFERVAGQAGYRILDRRLYFINPHYETKFGMTPRRLWRAVAAVPYLRNFATTSCFYLLKA